jgi:hypothetical protein
LIPFFGCDGYEDLKRYSINKTDDFDIPTLKTYFIMEGMNTNSEKVVKLLRKLFVRRFYSIYRVSPTKDKSTLMNALIFHEFTNIYHGNIIEN